MQDATYAVQSHECPLGRSLLLVTGKKMSSSIDNEQSRVDALKNLIARHTRAGIIDAGVVLEVCSSNPLCTHKIGTGKLWTT